MADLINGERIGTYLVFKDEDGLRHAIRSSAVLAFSESLEGADLTIMQMSGNRAIVIRRPLEIVLSWLC